MWPLKMFNNKNVKKVFYKNNTKRLDWHGFALVEVFFQFIYSSFDTFLIVLTLRALRQEKTLKRDISFALVYRVFVFLFKFSVLEIMNNNIHNSVNVTSIFMEYSYFFKFSVLDKMNTKI